MNLSEPLYVTNQVTKGGVLSLLQPFRWCCVDCVIHHERDVPEE